MKKKAIVIGSGIGGLAVAIRLAKQNFDVHVYEKNAYPGGKLCEMQLGKYRFDKGPSLFTMPQLIDELSDLSSYKKLAYKKLETITHYFYEDGTTLTAQADVNEFAKELNTKLGEDIEQVKKHLKRSDFFYNTTAPLFLEQSTQ